MLLRLFRIKVCGLVIFLSGSCGGKPLYNAIVDCFHKRSYESCFMLLAENGQLNTFVTITNWVTLEKSGFLSPLHLAVRCTSDAVRTFLQMNNPFVPCATLDIEARDSEKKTPFMLALELRVTQSGRKDDYRRSAHYLMQAGARWREEDQGIFDPDIFRKMKEKYKKYNGDRFDGKLPVLSKEPFQPIEIDKTDISDKNVHKRAISSTMKSARLDLNPIQRIWGANSTSR